MPSGGVSVNGGGANDPEATLKALAAEQEEHRKMLRDLQKLTIQHVRECGKLQKVTATELTKLSGGLTAIERRFEVFDKVTGFLLKHGKKLGYVAVTALISAYVGLLVQSWALHQDSTAHALDAANKAAAAQSAVQQIPDRTVQKLEDRHVTVAP